MSRRRFDRMNTKERNVRIVYFRETLFAKLKLSRLLASFDGFNSFRGSSFRSKVVERFSPYVSTEKRKLIVHVAIHTIATLVVWSHFFYIKYRVQESKVLDGANLYWWKRFVSPFEFGAMHVILFQMSLLPLTMADRQ